jgi:uncharacterized cysteine cluster protein YcgN (CxxCxxCC family)
MPRLDGGKQPYSESSYNEMETPTDEALTSHFWELKTLTEMTAEEWEALCDGCGQCCLVKLEDEDTGDIAVTTLSCHLLDVQSCRCSDYQQRQSQVPDCIKLTPADVAQIRWLPATCAYRLIAQGDPLPWWHPLVSGDPETVHIAGMSVKNFAKSEKTVPVSSFPDHIASWLR